MAQGSKTVRLTVDGESFTVAKKAAFRVRCVWCQNLHEVPAQVLLYGLRGIRGRGAVMDLICPSCTTSSGMTGKPTGPAN